MKKILVIINKNWETEPVLNALTNPKLRPSGLHLPEILNTPCDGNNRMDAPRAIFKLNSKNGKTAQITIRCIEDIMAAGVNTSNSLEKYKVLPSVISKEAADFIISVSTANYPDPDNTHNGTVIIGGNFFIHDGNPHSKDDPTNNLIHPAIGTFMTSNVDPKIFDLIEAVNARLHCYPKGKSKLIPPPNYPASDLLCKGVSTYTAIGSINVAGYDDYDIIDSEALKEFTSIAPSYCTANSIETTHGVVKISTTEEPIIFLSPITDRLNHFNEDVTDTQNYVAAFNGGLALGELLCELANYLLKE